MKDGVEVIYEGDTPYAIRKDSTAMLIREDQVEDARTYGLCGCGKVAQKFQSGTPTCWKCWHWWKLGYAEAKFWYLGISQLRDNDFGSGPDMNDLMQWDRWEVKDEVLAALETLEKLKARYVAAAEEYGLDLEKATAPIEKK